MGGRRWKASREELEIVIVPLSVLQARWSEVKDKMEDEKETDEEGCQLTLDKGLKVIEE